MNDRYDLIVVGAGPCGIAVGAAAANAGLGCALFERGAITNSLLSYPHYMTFFSTATKLEVGDVPFTIPDAKPTRREALAYYRKVVQHWSLDVHQYEEVTSISGEQGNFLVQTSKNDGSVYDHKSAAVVVATGGFQTPNYLNVPGEELEKVKHYYHEPYPYYEQEVLVVGAGNSAVEAALEMYRNGVRVSLVHFGDTIDRGVKPWVAPDINNRLKLGEIPVYWKHRVAEVKPSTVILRSEENGAETEIQNDFVVAMTGWQSDQKQLAMLGVSIDKETGIPSHNKNNMMTDVPGLYIAGVIAAGHNANKIFIENGREHGHLIVSDRLAQSV